MLSVLASVLCRQGRFDDSAISTARAKEGTFQPRVFRSVNCWHSKKRSAKSLLGLDKPEKALPILLAVATSELGTARDCAEAAYVAIGSGDVQGYRKMCGVGLARFTAGAEGINALSLSEMFLASPQDELIVQVVGELVRARGTGARFLQRLGGRDCGSGSNTEREIGPTLAARLSKSSDLPFPRCRSLLVIKSRIMLACDRRIQKRDCTGRLGRVDEAQDAYAAGMKVGRASFGGATARSGRWLCELVSRRRSSP